MCDWLWPTCCLDSLSTFSIRKGQDFVLPQCCTLSHHVIFWTYAFSLRPWSITYTCNLCVNKIQVLIKMNECHMFHFMFCFTFHFWKYVFNMFLQLLIDATKQNLGNLHILTTHALRHYQPQQWNRWHKVTVMFWRVICISWSMWDKDSQLPALLQ